MAEQVESPENTIDTAINSCVERIKAHRSSANFFLALIIALVLIFVGSIVTLYTKDKLDHAIDLFFESAAQDNIESIKRTTETAELINENIGSVDKLIMAFNKNKASNNIDSLLLLFDRHTTLLANFKSKLIDINDKIDTSYYSLRKTARSIREYSMPEKDEKINIFYYLLYGLFLVILGIITSFYRFHLKEISKLEKLHLGFLRIRIAGNNSKTGFEDVVKQSLTTNAFQLEYASSKVENPMPGHPVSEIVTDMLDKILDKFNLTPKK